MKLMTQIGSPALTLSAWLGIIVLGMLLTSHRSGAKTIIVTDDPVIRLTKTPPRGAGPDRMETIAGTVSNVDVKKCDCQVVIYALGDIFYVQPFAARPFTMLNNDGSFENETHLGSQYAVLLVKKSYQPPSTLGELPRAGGEVMAVTVVKARSEENKDKDKQAAAPARTIRFSGYEWKVKASGAKPVGPGPNLFSDSEQNVWVDHTGQLHLRITQREGQWHCAEVVTAESYGYGTYSFSLASEPQILEKALHAVLGMFTWDDGAPEHHYSEIDFELSAWSKPGNKLAQWVIQPYTIPRNLSRFDLPKGLGATQHIFTWRPESVECQSLASDDTAPAAQRQALFRHSFKQGIPPATPGANARINLWLFDQRPPADGKEVEVIISKFDFTPLA